MKRTRGRVVHVESLEDFDRRLAKGATSMSRLIEIADNGDGTLSIYTTMLDHAGPASNTGLGDTKQLAGLGREMAANDPQNRTDSGRGQLSDRNLELVVAKPV